MTGLSLNFANPTNDQNKLLHIGADAAVGFQYEWKNIQTVAGTRIDARATITQMDNVVREADDDADDCGDPSKFRMSRLDRESGSSPNDWILSRIRVCPAGGFVEFTLDFFATAGNDPNFATSPVVLRNVKVNFTDVDNSEFMWLYGARSFRLTELSTVTVTADESKLMFTAQSGGLSDNDSLTKGQVEATLGDSSSHTMRFGRSRSGTGSSTKSSNFFADFSGVNDNPTIGLRFLDDVAVTSLIPPAASQGVPATLPPAIHKDLRAKTGSEVSETPVLIEGQGLLPGAVYTLTLSSTPQVISSGIANGQGLFSQLVSLPGGIPPGVHSLTLSAQGPDGTTLTLTTRITVASDGTIASLVSGDHEQQRGLAVTGMDGSQVSSIALVSLSLVAFGLLLYFAPKARAAHQYRKL
jgi:hypothetical protein